jgi:parvulin-like peptidyl-prolyl isomerase
LRSWLREPLLHFVLLGAALFALADVLDDRSVEAAEDRIVVTPGRVENLRALFEKTWRRPPRGEELQGLVEDYVLEEALYREGLALGLDQDDSVVRRRMRQKLEFVAEDLLDRVEPTEADLRAWFEAHPDAYARPARLTFRQVLVSSEREDTQADAQAFLTELRAGTVDPATAGDGVLLARAFADAEADVVARTFDEAFVTGLAAAPIGEWTGPLASPYGLHLVLVSERVPGELPVLEDVGDQVERDWLYARRQEAEERFHREVLERYRISIEWPAR